MPMRVLAPTVMTRPTMVAAAVMVVGAALLLAAALVELASGQPGMTIMDAYWVGRLPWTPIGVGMMLFGASATVVVGPIAAWLNGGAGARIVATAAVLPTAFWWAVSPMVGFAGSCCGPRPAYDPITIAYSSPEGPFLFVVLPAIVITALVLVTSRPRTAAAAFAAGDPSGSPSGSRPA